MFQPLIEVAFLLIYAAMLAAVTPYVTGDNESYGTLVPGAAAIATGAVLWSVLTWLGLPDTDGWIWSLTMILMPVGMGFALKYYARFRGQGKLGFVDQVAESLTGSSKSSTDEGNAEDMLIITSTSGS
jgi:hypothetical protein